MEVTLQLTVLYLRSYSTPGVATQQFCSYSVIVESTLRHS